MADLPDHPRPMSLVRFNFDSIPTDYHKKYPFSDKGVYLFLGEICNMRGHCVVCDHVTGQIYSGYHTENFVELDDEE